MLNQLKIEELFVVGDEVFESKKDAQEYIDNIQQARSENKYHDTIYYENWTTDGEEGERQVCHARWQTYQDALQAMSYYANSWRPNGTGWINKVTIITKPDTSIKIKTEKVHENM